MCTAPLGGWTSLGVSLGSRGLKNRPGALSRVGGSSWNWVLSLRPGARGLELSSELGLSAASGALSGVSFGRGAGGWVGALFGVGAPSKVLGFVAASIPAVAGRGRALPTAGARGALAFPVMGRPGGREMQCGTGPPSPSHPRP